MRTTMMLLFLGVAAVAGARDQLAPLHGEAPRATDLQRAERLADTAARRLKLPRARQNGWSRGGAGWGSAAEAPVAEEDPGGAITPRPKRRK
jgi:hypothetical protein